MSAFKDLGETGKIKEYFVFNYRLFYSLSRISAG